MMKVNKLQGAALDWAVANCEGKLSQHGGQVHLVESKVRFYGDTLDIQYTPSTDWSQGGPIIERENISVMFSYDLNVWVSAIGELWVPEEGGIQGPTPLVAAMRCYVAGKMGDDVEIPEGLI